MEITIDKESANQRFDRFLRKYCKQYPNVSLSEIYKGMRKWLIKLNGKKAKENKNIQEWDTVTIHDAFDLWDHNPNAAKSIKDRQKEHIDWTKIQKRIIDETADRLVRNKPADIVMHESQQHYKDLSMHDYLDEYLKKTSTSSSWTKWKIQDNQKTSSSWPSSEAKGKDLSNHKDSSVAMLSQNDEANTFKPSFGYRLDKDTSWVLIAAKTYNALQYINKIIRDRKVDKYYMAIVIWSFPKERENTKSLEKWYSKKFGRAQVEVSKKGKQSQTQARCMHTRNHSTLWPLSLVKVKITTGRMHQIRVHLADDKYPVLGDIVYGNPAVNRKFHKIEKIQRQLLHCRNYQFYDEINQTQQSRQAPLPQEFMQIWCPIL